jgi:hypothetical protein
MRLSTSIIAISALVIVQASAIPEATKTFSLASDAPNGFYLHFFDPDGKPQNANIGDINTVFPDLDHHTNSSIPNPKKRRDEKNQGVITCRNQYELNYNDVIAAEQGLGAMFQFGGSFSDKTVSYKHGGVVAYGCNYGNSQTITATWLAAQFAQIAQHCGATGGGWVSYPDWKASYGLDSSGVGFCG